MSQKDLYKQAFHLQPLAGSLADPNGVCQVDDTYHIYYLIDPESFTTSTRTPCIWAQYTTKDFVGYKREPYAIFADDRYDRDGVFSGCVVVDNDQIHAIYTGNVRHAGNYDYIHEGREQNILKTSSKDGITFANKHLLMRNSDFPDDMTNHVRDPFITYVDGRYQMVLGARRNDDVGLALVYHSDDLEHFTLAKRITTEAPFGYMWECPELLTIDGDDLLIACPQGLTCEREHVLYKHQCGYFHLVDGYAQDFTSFDYGFDFYAARTCIDGQGRRILFGWMGISESPYQPTLTAAVGYDQCLAMPRQITYKDHHLYQAPLEEFKALRVSQSHDDGKEEHTYQSPLFEVELTFDSSQDMTLTFDYTTSLSYDNEHHLLILTFNSPDEKRDQRMMDLETLSNLRIFRDHSSLEIFINDGYATMTSRIFSTDETLHTTAFNGTIDYYVLKGFQID